MRILNLRILMAVTVTLTLAVPAFAKDLKHIGTQSSRKESSPPEKNKTMSHREESRSVELPKKSRVDELRALAKDPASMDSKILEESVKWDTALFRLNSFTCEDVEVRRISEEVLDGTRDVAVLLAFKSDKKGSDNLEHCLRNLAKERFKAKIEKLANKSCFALDPEKIQERLKSEADEISKSLAAEYARYFNLRVKGLEGLLYDHREVEPILHSVLQYAMSNFLHDRAKQCLSGKASSDSASMGDLLEPERALRKMQMMSPSVWAPFGAMRGDLSPQTLQQYPAPNGFDQMGNFNKARIDTLRDQRNLMTPFNPLGIPNRANSLRF